MDKKKCHKHQMRAKSSVKFWTPPSNKKEKETKQKSKTPSKTGQQELKIEEKQTNTTLDSFQ